MLEKIEGQIRNWQSRDAYNIGDTKHKRKTKKTKKHNTENQKEAIITLIITLSVCNMIAVIYTF